jgi:hypothetical protein
MLPVATFETLFCVVSPVALTSPEVAVLGVALVAAGGVLGADELESAGAVDASASPESAVERLATVTLAVLSLSVVAGPPPPPVCA